MITFFFPAINTPLYHSAITYTFYDSNQRSNTANKNIVELISYSNCLLYQSKRIQTVIITLS